LSLRTPLARFFRLLTDYRAPQVFNPWTEHDADTDLDPDAALARLRRLHSHLGARPRVILLGEASGYQGCHVSGIPFTSERLLIAGAIPRVTLSIPRLSSRPLPWSEPSATTVWSTLHELGIAAETVLWNAFPWHPHQSGNKQSNRTPKPQERMLGLPVLEALLAAFPGVELAAVGRHAQQSMADCGRKAYALRHPSMGGASAFRAGLKRFVARAP
jgi:uracil-DNA glycosylase